MYFIPIFLGGGVAEQLGYAIGIWLVVLFILIFYIGPMRFREWRYEWKSWRSAVAERKRIRVLDFQIQQEMQRLNLEKVPTYMEIMEAKHSPKIPYEVPPGVSVSEAERIAVLKHKPPELRGVNWDDPTLYIPFMPIFFPGDGEVLRREQLEYLKGLSHAH